jgi:hypothetical protein
MNPANCPGCHKFSKATFYSGNGTNGIWSLTRTGPTLSKAIGLSSFHSSWAPGRVHLGTDVCGASNLGAPVYLDLLSNTGS